MTPTSRAPMGAIPALGRRGFLAAGLAALLLPRAARGWSGSVDAALFGAKGDGETDNAPMLERAVAEMSGTGGVLRLAPGRYRLGRSVRLRSGLTITGPGATLFSDNRWTVPEGTPRVSRFALLTNRNAQADALTDSDIAVRDLGFAFQGQLRGDAHAVTFRRARRITVSGCSFAGRGGNATAMLNCLGTVVERCRSTGTVNCAYDHWEGSSDALVRDCQAVCALGYGILFTGQGTANDDHRTAARMTATGNRIEQAGSAGIWACSLSEGSAVTDIVISGNTVVAGGAKGAGIGGTGAIRNMAIRGNTIEGIAGGNAVFSRPDKWNRPRGIEISGNRMRDCMVNERGIALIQALGDQVQVRGNRAAGGRYRSLVWVDGEGVVLEDNQGDGLSSRFKYNAAAARAPRIADP